MLFKILCNSVGRSKGGGTPWGVWDFFPCQVALRWFVKCRESYRKVFPPWLKVLSVNTVLITFVLKLLTMFYTILFTVSVN